MNLQELIVNTFVQKECDLQAPNVRAAICYAVQKMSLAADDAYNPDEILAQTASLFHLTEEEKNLVSVMTSPYVRAAIGYSVQVEDYGSARKTYETNKLVYDQIFNGLSQIEVLHTGSVGRR